jgi:hypothetical protein
MFASKSNYHASRDGLTLHRRVPVAACRVADQCNACSGNVHFAARVPEGLQLAAKKILGLYQ